MRSVYASHSAFMIWSSDCQKEDVLLLLEIGEQLIYGLKTRCLKCAVLNAHHVLCINYSRWTYMILVCTAPVVVLLFSVISLIIGTFAHPTKKKLKICSRATAENFSTMWVGPLFYQPLIKHYKHRLSSLRTEIDQLLQFCLQSCMWRLRLDLTASLLHCWNWNW